MAKFEFVEWLLFWLVETRSYEFNWDRGNRTKNEKKHQVTTAEIEEVFYSKTALPLGVQISPSVSEERLGVIGYTFKGRLLHVVFTTRDGNIRPISGRPAHKKEKIQYESLLRKISQGVR